MGHVIETYKGHVLYQPTSGGKAGKGNEKTSTIQVRVQHGMIRRLVKQFRYSKKDQMGKLKATIRAKRFIDEQGLCENPGA